MNLTVRISSALKLEYCVQIPVEASTHLWGFLRWLALVVTSYAL